MGRKQTAVEFIKKVARAKETLIKAYENNDFGFISVTEREIHYKDELFMKLANDLGVNVICFDPNWSKNHPETGIKYFWYEVDGHMYKVFSLWDKESEVWNG